MDAAAASWLTYGQLADALSIELRSARNLVRRKRWRRQRGNDGLARVEVPREVLERRLDGTTEGAVEGTVEGTVSPAIDGPSTFDVLHRHIERLEAELSVQRAEREAMRARVEGLTMEAAAAPVLRESVEALKQALEAERQLKGELRREMERLSRPWWRRLRLAG